MVEDMDKGAEVGTFRVFKGWGGAGQEAVKWELAWKVLDPAGLFLVSGGDF